MHLEYIDGWNNVCKLQGIFIHPLSIYIYINVKVVKIEFV